jgi:hypothetical protein
MKYVQPVNDNLVNNMTKRELFAILALVALLHQYEESEELIELAVEMADALIDQLNKRWN